MSLWIQGLWALAKSRWLPLSVAVWGLRLHCSYGACQLETSVRPVRVSGPLVSLVESQVPNVGSMSRWIWMIFPWEHQSTSLRQYEACRKYLEVGKRVGTLSASTWFNTEFDGRQLLWFLELELDLTSRFSIFLEWYVTPPQTDQHRFPMISLQILISLMVLQSESSEINAKDVQVAAMYLYIYNPPMALHHHSHLEAKNKHHLLLGKPTFIDMNNLWIARIYNPKLYLLHPYIYIYIIGVINPHQSPFSCWVSRHTR